MCTSRYDNVIKDLLPLTSSINDALNAARAKDRRKSLEAIMFVLEQAEQLKKSVALLEIDSPCEHEYLPDEDGNVYTCGDDDTIEINGKWLCFQHM